MGTNFHCDGACVRDPRACLNAMINSFIHISFFLTTTNRNILLWSRGIRAQHSLALPSRRQWKAMRTMRPDVIATLFQLSLFGFFYIPINGGEYKEGKIVERLVAFGCTRFWYGIQIGENEEKGSVCLWP